MPRGRKKRTREDPVSGEGDISDKQQDLPTSVAAGGDPTPEQQSSEDRVAKTKQQKRKKKSRRVIDDTQSSQTLDDDKSPQVNPSVSETTDLPSENIDAVDKAADITTNSPSSKQLEIAITSTLASAEVQVAASAPETPNTAEVQVAASATEIIAPTVQGLKSTQSKKGRKPTKNSPVTKNVQAPTNVRTTNTEPSDSPTTSIEEKDKTPLISQVLEDDIIGDEMVKTNSAASSSTVQPPPISERHFHQYRYNPPFPFLNVSRRLKCGILTSLLFVPLKYFLLLESDVRSLLKIILIGFNLQHDLQIVKQLWKHMNPTLHFARVFKKPIVSLHHTSSAFLKVWKLEFYLRMNYTLL